VKYLYLLVFVIILSSCHRNKFVEINGNIPGINNGAFIIKTQDGPQLISEFITDGKFHAKVLLQMQGFYDVFIIPDIANQNHNKKLYEIYLEPGNYTITADKDKLYLYPKIQSESKPQNQLSEYYNIALQKQHEMLEQKDSIGNLLYGPNTLVVIKSPQYYSLLKQIEDSKTKADKIQAATLSDFITKNPQNEIEAFLMSQTNYQKYPKDYNSIYQKFTAEQKKTPIGQQEGDDLSQLVKGGK